MGRFHAGRLLISRPELTDPNFDGTITYLIDHNEDGALGVIINRPTPLAMGDPFPEWVDLSSGPGMIFSGGPVQTNALIALGRTAEPDGPLPHGLHSIDLDEQPSLVAGTGIVEVRVFAGHAGWGAGQLEGEMANGAWWLADATANDVFCDRPRELWAQVLQRSGGEMAWYAHLPADPTLN